MRSDLEKYQAEAQGKFDFSQVQALVDRLEGQFRALDDKIAGLNSLETLTPEQEQQAKELNDLCMELNRILIPVHYCKNGDLFQVDLAIPIPAFPEFDEVKKLAAMDPASDGFKFQERQLLRERNRVYHYLNKAVKRLEAAGL